MTLSKNQLRLLIISNMGCWSLLLLLLFTSFTKQGEKVITAERINIVNEDGKIIHEG